MTAPPRDRRNRKYGTVKTAVPVKIWLLPETKKALAALRNREEGAQVSYGAVVEMLIERHRAGSGGK